MLKNILELSHEISKYCIGMEGNISGKVNDNTFVIKASGTSLNKITSDDLITFNLDGTQITNLEKRGSLELDFHTFLLNFDDINYVVHTHPVNTLKILCGKNSHTFATERLFPDQVIFNGVKSCLVPYAKPGIELARLIKHNVNDFIKVTGYFPKLILLENHGIITCGKSVSECVIATEICEKSAEIFINNGINSNFLSSYNIKELMNDEREKYRLKQL